MKTLHVSELLPEDQMPEAEVALRLAFHMLEHPEGEDRVEVALDGAQVMISGKIIFAVRQFLESVGWQNDIADPSWQGTYRRGGKSLVVRSVPGVGDVVGKVGRNRVRAECKKGSLIRKKGSPEYGLLQVALAQLLTVEQVSEDDVLVAVVPHTPYFERLANLWRDRPLVRQAGLQIALVGRDGTVEGMEP